VGCFKVGCSRVNIKSLCLRLNGSKKNPTPSRTSRTSLLTDHYTRPVREGLSSRNDSIKGIVSLAKNREEIEMLIITPESPPMHRQLGRCNSRMHQSPPNESRRNNRSAYLVFYPYLLFLKLVPSRTRQPSHIPLTPTPRRPYNSSRPEAAKLWP
jgi:hypothetical protein